MTGSADDAVRALVAGGQQANAAEAALRAHGPEILGFLSATLRNEADAADVFSQFSIDVWRGLGTWRGTANLRAWMFTVARHASARYRRTQGRREKRQVAFDGDGGDGAGDGTAYSKLVHELRKSTLAYLKTETKTKVQRLREHLDVE